MFAKSVAVMTLTLAALLVGCGTEGPAYAPPTGGVAATVKATNNLIFEPETVRIRQGQTVEWRNVSVFTHTVTMTPEASGKGSDIQPPQGAEPFDVSLPPGEVYRHKFRIPGRYSYICTPHRALGMRGEVVVVPER